MQFQNAVLQEDGNYRLSRFLRGRKGTEWAVPTHQNSELFILIDPATLHRIKSAASEIGLSRIYKAITLGRSIPASSPYTFINTAIGKKPLSPVHLQGDRNKAGDLTLNWIPRTRIQGAWRDGVDAPSDPEREARRRAFRRGRAGGGDEREAQAAEGTRRGHPLGRQCGSQDDPGLNLRGN